MALLACRVDTQEENEFVDYDMETCCNQHYYDDKVENDDGNVETDCMVSDTDLETDLDEMVMKQVGEEVDDDDDKVVHVLEIDWDEKEMEYDTCHEADHAVAACYLIVYYSPDI